MSFATLMRVRIVALPATAFEQAQSELDLTNFQLGGLYEVDATAAAYLVACRYAVYEMRSGNRDLTATIVNRRQPGRGL